MFRLRTAQDVIQRLRFHNVGPQQVPGLIVMSLDGTGYPGAKYKSVVVVFNVDKTAKNIAVPELASRRLTLHRIQRGSSDPVMRTAAFDGASGTFSVPARTTAVFVENGASGD